MTEEITSGEEARREVGGRKPLESDSPAQWLMTQTNVRTPWWVQPPLWPRGLDTLGALCLSFLTLWVVKQLVQCLATVNAFMMQGWSQEAFMKGDIYGLIGAKIRREWCNDPKMGTSLAFGGK